VDRPTQEKPMVTINFGVDPHSVVFESLEGGLHSARLEFVTQAFDAKGKLAASKAETLATSLEDETYTKVMAGRLWFSQKIDLAPGGYTLKAGVRDEKTNLLGTVKGRIEVPSSH
jgi:hypothetical protein